MRYFNTHGPVNETEHYVVARDKLLAELVAQIENGKYFTIFAPRQMGKTTLLRRLRTVLEEQNTYLPVTLSFEIYESASSQEFLQGLWTEFTQGILDVLGMHDTSAVEPTRQLLEQATPQTLVGLFAAWESLHRQLPEWRIVLIIDEFDGTPLDAISSLLQNWRKIYLDTIPPRSLRSVVLIGLQNIATLNLGRSSPFNIANQLELPVFTQEQVQQLFAQYSTETGQAVPAQVLDEIHRLTGGQPFLVNRLGAILTEELVTDRSQPITLDVLATAHQQLVRERNYNFETIIRRAEPHIDDVMNILFGAEYEFNLNNPVIHALHMHGIISRTAEDLCQISNPTYAEVLLAAFRPVRARLQADILVNGYDFRSHRTDDALPMDLLLSQFRIFVERRGREAFKVTPTPQEATGQYLLMAYLNLVVRHLGGDLFTEIDTNSGRMDLIVVHNGLRYIIETKIWRGPLEFDEGLDQLAGYLSSEGQSTGYYVVSHARPNVYGKLRFDELEFRRTHAGKEIFVYLVRLGSIFGEGAAAESSAAESGGEHRG
ncbi:MAG: AAA-like domain-containing protein [Caldilineaceae bacterium]